MKKKSKLKKAIIIFGITFLAVVAVLTYFAGTIEYMLLPRVSVANIESGQISGEPVTEQGVCLVPNMSVVESDGIAYIFILYQREDNTAYIEEVNVQVRDRNNMYCEIKLDPTFTSYSVVYETSRDLVNGDKVVVEAN